MYYQYLNGLSTPYSLPPTPCLMKPRIAIPVPPSTDPTYNQRSWPQYAEAVERAGGAPIATPPPAAIAPDSLLGTIIPHDEAPEQDGFLRLPINSSHHQAIGIPGDGLRVAARCPQDAVIEAVEGGLHSTTHGDSSHPHFA